MNKQVFLTSLASMVLTPAFLSAVESEDVVELTTNPKVGSESQMTYGIPTCNNIHISTRCLPCEQDYVCETTSNRPSHIMIGGLRYYTWSNDYISRTDPSGCSPCGSIGSGNASARLPELHVTRFFEPLSYGREHLTFGALQGMKEYDQRLDFTPNKESLNVTDYGSYLSKRGLQFDQY